MLGEGVRLWLVVFLKLFFWPEQRRQWECTGTHDGNGLSRGFLWSCGENTFGFLAEPFRIL